jgi:hypothetical protein
MTDQCWLIISVILMDFCFSCLVSFVSSGMNLCGNCVVLVFSQASKRSARTRKWSCIPRNPGSFSFEGSVCCLKQFFCHHSAIDLLITFLYWIFIIFSSSWYSNTLYIFFMPKNEGSLRTMSPCYDVRVINISWWYLKIWVVELELTT